MRREFIIDGSNFSDIEGFYCEIDKLLTKDLSWKTGHNLDAFNDLLRGGFGVHEYNEPIILKWINYKKSLSDFGYEATAQYYEKMRTRCHPTCVLDVENLLNNAKNKKGDTLMAIIVGIILDKNNSGHDCELVTID